MWMLYAEKEEKYEMDLQERKMWSLTGLICQLFFIDCFESAKCKLESIFLHWHCSGLEIQVYGRRDLSRWPRGILYPQKLALTSLTIGGPLACRIRLRNQATDFSFLDTVWSGLRR
jgi:hypothetical protein